MRNHKPLVLISIALVLVVSLAAPSTSLAQGNGDGDTPGEALGVLENTFKNLGVLAIKFMYTLSFIVVLVGELRTVLRSTSPSRSVLPVWRQGIPGTSSWESWCSSYSWQHYQSSIWSLTM